MILVRRALAIATAALIIAALPAGAADDKVLSPVRGISGYRTAVNAPFTRLFGRTLVEDDWFAQTAAASNALLTLPDSSVVALGEDTSVQVGAFNDPTSVTPTTITLDNGTLRFAIRHPAGGRANFVFKTITSQIAVRGTTGLYASGPSGDVVTCLDCAAGDVTVTVGARSYPLLSGQTLLISLAGVVTSVAAAVVAQAFSGTGLSTSLASHTAFTGAVGSGSGAAASIPAATYPVAGAVFAAGAAAAISGANSGHAAIAVPVPTATPAVGTGNATLSGIAHKH